MSTWNTSNPFGKPPSGSGSGSGSASTLAVQTFYDARPSGESGGPASAYGGAYFTRQLNKASPPLAGGNTSAAITGMSLTANSVTVPAGTYFVEAAVTGAFCAYHKARLWNVTDGQAALVGMSSYENSGALEDGRAIVQGTITLTQTKVFQIQHIMEAAQGYAFDQGFANSIAGDEETYVTLTFFKLA